MSNWGRKSLDIGTETFDIYINSFLTQYTKVNTKHMLLSVSYVDIDFDINLYLKQYTKENTKHKLLSVSYVEMLSAHQMSDWVCTCSDRVSACLNM